MRWVLAVLFMEAACTSPQHAHVERPRSTREHWEDGVGEPRRMKDLDEVAPAVPMDCGDHFQNEDPAYWTEEHIDCIVEHGVSSQLCKCMESKMENRFWER